MAMGGFNGSDPTPTLAEFQAYVRDRAIRYYLSGRSGTGAWVVVPGTSSAPSLPGYSRTSDPACGRWCDVYDLRQPLNQSVPNSIVST